MEDRLKEVLASFQGTSTEIIPILQEVQELYSYLPEDAMRSVAKFVRVAESRVYAVASFFAQFRFTPMGKNKVMVCRGTACHVRGAKRVQEEVENILNIGDGETTEDFEYTMETVACIGCCALAPCVMVNEKVEANLTPKKVREIFEKETADDV